MVPVIHIVGTKHAHQMDMLGTSCYREASTRHLFLFTPWGLCPPISLFFPIDLTSKKLWESCQSESWRIKHDMNSGKYHKMYNHPPKNCWHIHSPSPPPPLRNSAWIPGLGALVIGAGGTRRVVVVGHLHLRCHHLCYGSRPNQLGCILLGRHVKLGKKKCSSMNLLQCVH